MRRWNGCSGEELCGFFLFTYVRNSIEVSNRTARLQLSLHKMLSWLAFTGLVYLKTPVKDGQTCTMHPTRVQNEKRLAKHLVDAQTNDHANRSNHLVIAVTEWLRLKRKSLKGSPKRPTRSSADIG
jgi:hypothetical protein